MGLFVAFAIAFVVILTRGGKVHRLANLKLRLIPVLIIAAVSTKLVFETGLYYSNHQLGWAIWTTGFLLTAIVMWVNRERKGLVVAGIGSLLNALSIAAGGGHMPVGRSAFKAFQMLPEWYRQPGIGNWTPEHWADPSATPLWFLGDVIPTVIPFSFPFSIGDALLAGGIIALVGHVMLSSDVEPVVEDRAQPKRGKRRPQQATTAAANDQSSGAGIAAPASAPVGAQGAPIMATPTLLPVAGTLQFVLAEAYVMRPSAVSGALSSTPAPVRDQAPPIAEAATIQSVEPAPPELPVAGSAPEPVAQPAEPVVQALPEPVVEVAAAIRESVARVPRYESNDHSELNAEIEDLCERLRQRSLRLSEVSPSADADPKYEYGQVTPRDESMAA